MGREARCRVRRGRTSFDADVKLESGELIVRADRRHVLPFGSMTSVREKDGSLSLRTPDASWSFELGAQATRWAETIRNPKSVLDRLGVKAGQRVAVIGLVDPDFLESLLARGAVPSKSRAAKDLDVVFLSATKRAELAKLTALARTIQPAGAIWVLWPKGRPELREDDVRVAALKVGLVDVKVVSFSTALSALKLVIPVAKRPRGSR